MKKFLIALAVVVVAVVVVVLIGRNKKISVDDQAFVYGDAVVEDISLNLLETFPVQVQVTAEGSLSDGCTTLGDIEQSLIGDTFFSTIKTKRMADAVCAEVITPFTHSFLLDGTVGLPAGAYKVDINGVLGDFTFDVDNFLTDFDPQK